MKNLNKQNRAPSSLRRGGPCYRPGLLGAFDLKGGNDRPVYRRLIKNETPESSHYPSGVNQGDNIRNKNPQLLNLSRKK